MSEGVAVEETTFCAVHPNRETALRCNKCNRFMCVQCAVSTPVGYRCRECVRQQDDRFFTGTSMDYLLTAAVGVISSAMVSAVLALIPFGFFLGFLVGAPAGALIAQIALFVTYKRRGRYSVYLIVAAIVIGGLFGVLLRRTNIGVWVFIFTAASAAYARYGWGGKR